MVFPAPDPPPGFPRYNAYFDAGGITAWFYIQWNGYGTEVIANNTVESIPWASTYSINIQRGGLQPMHRSYRAMVYSEPDFGVLASRSNVPGGTLMTPREVSVAANLDSFRRGQNMDYTNAQGITEVELTFTILAV